MLLAPSRGWLESEAAEVRLGTKKEGEGGRVVWWSKRTKALRRARRRVEAPEEPRYCKSLEKAEAAFPPKSGPEYEWYEVHCRVEWGRVPRSLDVEGGGLPARRRERKRLQLENMVAYADALADEGARVVDFCCGVGHQSLPLAWARPDLTVILVDRHAASLELAKARVEIAGLTNVRFRTCTVADFREPFDVGLALHACGAATDDVLAACVAANARFVVSPCCLGGVRPEPKSRLLSERLDPAGFLDLAKAADTVHTMPGKKKWAQRVAARARCMTLLDLDRLAACEERGYATSLTRMQPPSATPKNHILLGAPSTLPLQHLIQASSNFSVTAARHPP